MGDIHAEFRTASAKDVEVEAERLLQRIKEWRSHKYSPGYYPSPEWAAVERASMDLTRSLAKLRRGPYGRS